MASRITPPTLLPRFPSGHSAIWDDSLLPSLRLLPAMLCLRAGGDGDPGIHMDPPRAEEAEASLRVVVETAVASEILEV